jgi:hypothetical protein
MATPQTQAINSVSEAIASELARHDITPIEIKTRLDGKVKSTFVRIAPEDRERAETFAAEFNGRIAARDFRINQ